MMFKLLSQCKQSQVMLISFQMRSGSGPRKRWSLLQLQVSAYTLESDRLMLKMWRKHWKYCSLASLWRSSSNCGCNFRRARATLSCLVNPIFQSSKVTLKSNQWPHKSDKTTLRDTVRGLSPEWLSRNFLDREDTLSTGFYLHEKDQQCRTKIKVAEHKKRYKPWKQLFSDSFFCCNIKSQDVCHS